MLQIPQTVLEKWAFDLFQNEKAEAGLYPAFEQFLLGAYRRARHDEAVDSAFGLGCPFAEEFSQFLTTIPCPDFLAEEARSDFACYREAIDEGFPHRFAIRYAAERRRGAEREEAIECIFSLLDDEDRLDFLWDYLLAHGRSERTARDCSLQDSDETPLADILANFRARECEEERLLELGFPPDRAYAFAKAACEGHSPEEADLYSWYFEREMQRKSEWEEAQYLAQEFMCIVPVYASLHENCNYESFTYALHHAGAFQSFRERERVYDSLELFMTIAVRLQAQKETSKEAEFYSEIETLTGKIGRGEMALSDLPGTAPSEPQDWRIALRRHLKEEEEEWESDEHSPSPEFISDLHDDPLIELEVSSFKDRLTP